MFKILTLLCVMFYYSCSCKQQLYEDKNSFEYRQKYFKWPLSQTCLDCIWKYFGAKEGNELNGGPFFISKYYWSDANSPTVNNENPKDKNAYKNCVRNVYCSMVTMQNYMNRYKQFCSTTELTCYHYLKMHNLGGQSCNKEWNVKPDNADRICNFTEPTGYMHL
ncbi:unnamed protein product [Brassicogethes aeneus]|uniref:lysozyme n=1 Tax=Brassicogethes aeneus TaxID=1431903 RepID=A0A9P0B3A8_BRAAE|nr:unnamed protein product [Brassicogethes aeneus]